MPIDREAALKKAEKLLRQGKLDSAIEEYVRLIQDQPRDWNSINALGDLYLRAGNAEQAVAQFTRVADHLFTEGFLPKAAALYKKALKVQSGHEHTLSRLAEIATQQGLLVDAKTYLRQLTGLRQSRGDEAGVAECLSRLRALEADAGAEPAPAPAVPAAAADVPADEDPAHLFALARKELSSGDELRGRTLLTRALTLDPARHGDGMQLALDLAREGRVESAFGCVDVVSDAASLEGDWNRAVDALEAFVGVAPHLPALIKLVELCVDAGLDERLQSAQAKLADAYLAAGSGAEARVIAEDLLAQDPDSAAHADRLRRAVGLLGGEDAEQVLRDFGERRRLSAAVDLESAPAAEPPIVFETVEIDLSDALTGMGPSSRNRDAPPSDPVEVLDRALAHLMAGRDNEAIADLQEAAAAPRTRARAAAELGRLHVRRGDLEAGVVWLELAADGPAASPDEACEVLYELADALQRLGEPARALAILIDLDADAGGYRDVRSRIEDLARTQTGSERR